MTGGNIIAIASAKGGVGKTTTSINLAAATAAVNIGQSAVVVEADLAMPNIVDFLDLEFTPDSDCSLHGVLAGNCSITDAIYESPGVIDVVPGGPGLSAFANINVRKIADTIQNLRATYDLVLVDTGAGVSYESLLPIGVADTVVLVSTPRLASVRDTQKTKTLANQVGTTANGIIFTRVGTGNAPPSGQIAEFLGAELLGEIPEDETIFEAQDAGEPIITYDLSAPAAKAYWETAENLQIIQRGLQFGDLTG